MLDVGAQMIWTSPSLPYLSSNKSHISTTVDQQSWLLSVDNLTAIFGHCIWACFIDRIGRKYTLLIFGLVHLASWILINLAYNFTILFIARLIVGLGYGGTVITFQLYIGEIAGKNIRGILLSLLKISMNVGAFLMVACGAFLPYEAMNLTMLFLPIFALLLFPLMSESPYFHLMKGRKEKAIKTLMKFSKVNDPKMVMDDIERMKKVIEETEKSTNNIIQELFRDKGSRKAFIILIITTLAYGFSGFIAIRSIAQEILSYSGSSMKPEYETMILMGVQIFAGLPATQLIDRWGRRPVYLLSGIFSAISLIVVGLFFFLKNFVETDVSSLTWLPLIGLIVYMIVCNLGMTIMPFVLGGELLPVKVKGLALMFTFSTIDLSIFSAKMLLQNLSNSGHVYIALWLFTIACICGPTIIWIAMPETKGKNLEEVLILMSGKNRDKKSDNKS